MIAVVVFALIVAIGLFVYGAVNLFKTTEKIKNDPRKKIYTRDLLDVVFGRDIRDVYYDKKEDK